VAAIIDTGYKTKYKDVIEEVAENKYKDTPGISTLDEETAIAIMDDIKCNLSIGYSLNPNFENAIMTVDARNFSALGDTIVSSPDSSATYTIVHGPVYFDPTNNLKKGEILLDQYIANVLFPGGIPEAPFKIKLEKYQYPDKGGEITIDKEFTVVGVINRSVTGFGGYSCISAEDLLEIRGADVVPYAVYLENFTNSDTLIDEMAKSYFSWNSTSGTAVTLLNQSVSMFYDLFSLFEILLVILIVVFLASYSIRNIKSNYYQIGVIKAIGGRSLDISRIYTAQTAILTIIVCILTYFGAYYLVGVANDILIESFMSITNVSIGTINIIEFDIKIVISTMITTFLLSMLSTIVPLMTLHGIKPINIIKAKE
jgi:hypothetical protein